MECQPDQQIGKLLHYNIVFSVARHIYSQCGIRVSCRCFTRVDRGKDVGKQLCGYRVDSEDLNALKSTCGQGNQSILRGPTSRVLNADEGRNVKDELSDLWFMFATPLIQRLSLLSLLRY